MNEGRPIIHQVVERNPDIQGLQQDSDTVPNTVNYDRSRAHMISGDGHRNSNYRRPSMNIVNGDVPNHRPSQDRVHTRRYSETNVHSYHQRGVPQTETPTVQFQNHYSTRAVQSRVRRVQMTPDNGRETVVNVTRSARSSQSGRSYGNASDVDYRDERYVVPALPMPVAVFCCVLNFILPGFGSMVASVCVFCCARTDDMTCGEKCGSCCTVFGIGVLQLLLVACFLIGWIWSCIWGVTFIGMSASYYDAYYDDEEDPNVPHERSRRTRGRTPLPTPQVVEDQPYPGIRYDDIIEYERRRQQRRETQRRTRSRISLTPSNLIYPMRAPSNIAYNSPPPPYEESSSRLPASFIRGGRRSDYQRENGHQEDQGARRTTRSQDQSRLRPSHFAESIQEEDARR